MTNTLLEEIKLRKFIRKVIMIREEKILQERKKIMLEEKNLRKVIRHLLTEAEVDTDTEPVPYKSTAINFVNTVFGTVLKPIKTGLRTLTDGGEERVSYRDHIYQSLYDLFRTLSSVENAGESPKGGEALAEEKININIEDDDVEGDELAPDVEDPDAPDEKPTKEDEEEAEFKKFAIQGKDATGARVAFDTISNSNIEDTIQKYHRMLGDDEKRKQFEQYFMYNLDLFMIKYEKQLAGGLGQDPTFTEPVIPKPEGAVVREPAGAEEAGAPAEVGGEEAPPEEGEETLAPPPADEELPEL